MSGLEEQTRVTRTLAFGGADLGLQANLTVLSKLDMFAQGPRLCEPVHLVSRQLKLRFGHRRGASSLNTAKALMSQTATEMHRFSTKHC